MREARPHYSQAIEWRAPFWIDYGRGNEAQEQKTVGWFSMTAMRYLSLIPAEYPNAREGSINSHLEAVCQLSQSRQLSRDRQHHQRCAWPRQNRCLQASAGSHTEMAHWVARTIYAVARQSVNPVLPPIADELGTVTAHVG